MKKNNNVEIDEFEGRRFLSIDEVANYLGLQISTTRRFMDKIGAKREVFDKDVINKAVENAVDDAIDEIIDEIMNKSLGEFYDSIYEEACDRAWTKILRGLRND